MKYVQENPSHLGNPTAFRDTVLASGKWPDRKIQPSHTKACAHIEHNRKGLAKVVANDATKLSYNATPSYWRSASNDADESRNAYQTTDPEVQ